MRLREWQRECIKSALSSFKEGQSHFLCLATPGAGKTLMASRLAKKLIEANLIDFVICISPSVVVSEDFKVELEKELKRSIDGQLGALGVSITYQAMISADHIWHLLEEFRVFIIFDEIHHCAGNEDHNTNAWGQKILKKIQGKATYTLALSGTPWRSDSTPISLAQYSQSGEIRCDYIYGINQAIKDNVCRTPIITLFDNNEITLSSRDGCKHFQSIEQLMNSNQCSYQSLINNSSLIQHILNEAIKELRSLQEKDASAAGLIVASSVQHALKIHRLLRKFFGISANIVTYMDAHSVSLIQHFKHSDESWIISVGMISEGTNIPRLKVCCYLSRIRTEMYFRQVLGRVLRSTHLHRENGYFFAPAEPSIKEFATRINLDIPEISIINHKNNTELNIRSSNLLDQEPGLPDLENNLFLPEGSHMKSPNDLIASSGLSDTYESTLGLSKSFHKQLLTINHF